MISLVSATVEWRSFFETLKFTLTGKCSLLILKTKEYSYFANVELTGFIFIF